MRYAMSLTLPVATLPLCVVAAPERTLAIAMLATAQAQTPGRSTAGRAAVDVSPVAARADQDPDPAERSEVAAQGQGLVASLRLASCRTGAASHTGRRKIVASMTFFPESPEP